MQIELLKRILIFVIAILLCKITSFYDAKKNKNLTTEELKEILDELLWKELKDYSERQRFISFAESLISGLFDTNDERKFSELKSGKINI